MTEQKTEQELKESGADVGQKIKDAIEDIENVLVCLSRSDKELDILASVELLKEAGLEVVDVLKISKIVSGEIVKSKLDSLKSVKGVVSVDIDQELSAQENDSSFENTP